MTVDCTTLNSIRNPRPCQKALRGSKEGGERGRARVGGHRVEGGEWGGGGWKCPTGIAPQASPNGEAARCLGRRIGPEYSAASPHNEIRGTLLGFSLQYPIFEFHTESTESKSATFKSSDLLCRQALTTVCCSLLASALMKTRHNDSVHQCCSPLLGELSWRRRAHSFRLE